MQATETPRLERSVDDRVIAGVCGGVAEHFAIDPTIVRVVAVVLTLFGGAGLLLYLVGWAMIPEHGHRRSYADGWLRHPGWQPWLGIALIVIAFSIISDHVWHLGDIGFPVFLIGVGAFLLFIRPSAQGAAVSDVHASDASAPPATPTPPPTEPPTTDAPTIETPTAAAEPTVTMPTTAPPAVTAHDASWRDSRRAQRHELRADARRARVLRRREQRSVTRPALGILLLGAGITGVVIAAGGSVNPVAVLAIGLLVIGAALIVATRVGRATGLVPVGLVLLGALSVVSAIHIPFEGGGVGQRHETPLAISDIPSGGYHQAIGELRIDLAHLNTSNATQPIKITATVGIGHLLVIVPRDATVVVRGHTEIGDLRIINDDTSFWKVDRTVTLNGAQERAGRFEVDATIGIGAMEVQDAAA